MGGANQDPDFLISNNLSYTLWSLDWKLRVTAEEMAITNSMQAIKQKVLQFKENSLSSIVNFIRQTVGLQVKE
jgi:hypothetical protein